MSMTELTERAQQILLDNHIKGNSDECWLYYGIIRSTDGYGSIEYRRGDFPRYLALAHRIAYMYYNNIKVLDGSTYVLHRCDNPRCVNPNHLFEGTHLDNIDDMVNKEQHQHGTNHYKAYLTEDEVRQIRKEAARGKSRRQIARERGLCRQHVDAIVNGKMWKSVE